MKIENNFVPYELALKLKEKGFDYTCMARWDKIITTNPSTSEGNRKLELYVRGDYYDPISWTICNAPLFQQVTDWFREKYQCNIIITQSKHNGCWTYNLEGLDDEKSYYDLYKSYKTALTIAIEEALKLI